MLNLLSRPASALRSPQLRVPGDKSITHRAMILGSMASGETTVKGWLDGDDCRSALSALSHCGVRYTLDTDKCLRIEGLQGKFQAPPQALDCGNSGTAMRLLCGVLCGQDFSSVLTGDESLQKRPMQRILSPLQKMGANVTAQGRIEGAAPLSIEPVQQLVGIEYHSPVSSAQLKSCLLLAGLYADGDTIVGTPDVARDHTERMLEAFGAQIKYSGRRAHLKPSQLQGCEVQVPGDFSSAAFFMVAATLVPQSDILIKGVGVNPTRTAALDILLSMGADIELLNRRQYGAEDVADIRVRSARLTGVDIHKDYVSNAIDEFPILFIAAAAARGVTRLRCANELRHKESDRIAMMAQSLKTCGIDVQETDDGLDISGGTLRGGRIDSAGDHRVGMSLLIAGAASTEGIVVEDCDNIKTSFPDFVSLATSAHLCMEEVA